MIRAFAAGHVYAAALMKPISLRGRAERTRHRRREGQFLYSMP